MGRTKGSCIAPVRLSPSKIGSWMTCRRRYEIESEGWLPVTDAVAPVTGSAIHAGLAARATGQDPLQALQAVVDGAILEPADQDLVRVRATVLVQECPAAPWQIDAVETKLESRIPRTQKAVLSGICDQIATLNGEKWIVDHKVSSRYQSSDYAMLDLQLLAYYALGLEYGYKLRGAIWNAIIIPNTKPHKDESLEQYETRLTSCIRADPAKYYQYFPIVYTQEHVDVFWDWVKHIVAEIRKGVVYRNPKACQYLGCSYRSICLDSRNARIMGYRTKEDADAIAEAEIEG